MSHDQKREMTPEFRKEVESKYKELLKLKLENQIIQDELQSLRESRKARRAALRELGITPEE